MMNKFIGIVEIENQFKTEINLKTNDYLVFEYFDYYCSDAYQLFPPGSYVSVEEDINNNYTSLPKLLTGFVNTTTSIGNVLPNKYGVNEFKSDFTLSVNMILGNYATQPVENLTVTISESKLQIKYSDGVDFNNNLFEGTKYIFDTSKLDTEHSFSFSITERGHMVEV